MTDHTYYGETKCQVKLAKGDCCRNGAYYRINNILCCGTHSKKFIKQGHELITLTINPDKNKNKKKQLDDHEVSINVHMKDNINSKREPSIMLMKLGMFSKIEYPQGHILIFPNYKHKGRKDGIGMSSLSPKSLGPINHGQPMIVEPCSVAERSKYILLPPAKNLENFHQYNKCYKEEIDGEYPNEDFFVNQLRGYIETEPHRHKILRNGNVVKGKPEFSIWVDKKGVMHKLSYVESRQFYCTFYERLASVQPDFLKLVSLKEEGYNLCIVGYDAYVPEKSLEECYLDDSRPFGHELVLYTMLTCQPEDYPWRKHTTYEF